MFIPPPTNLRQTVRACEHLVEDGAEREDVGLWAGRFTQDLLRRQKSWRPDLETRATQRAGYRDRLRWRLGKCGAAGNAEIQHLDLSAGRHHHVAGLDVR